MASRNKDCWLLDTIPATSLLSLGSNKQTANKKHTMAKKKSPVGCFIMSLHFLEFTFFFQLEPKWTHQLKFYQLVCLCYTECFSFCKVFFFSSSIDMNSPLKKPPKNLLDEIKSSFCRNCVENIHHYWPKSLILNVYVRLYWFSAFYAGPGQFW